MQLSFIIFVRDIYKVHCITFPNLRYKYLKFHELLTAKLFENVRDFVDVNLTFKLNLLMLIKKLFQDFFLKNKYWIGI